MRINGCTNNIALCTTRNVSNQMSRALNQAATFYQWFDSGVARPRSVTIAYAAVNEEVTAIHSRISRLLEIANSTKSFSWRTEEVLLTMSSGASQRLWVE